MGTRQVTCPSRETHHAIRRIERLCCRLGFVGNTQWWNRLEDLRTGSCSVYPCSRLLLLQQVWMEGVFHRRIRVPFRTMSSPCRLTASTFLMDNSFLNSFHLRFSFPLFPTNTLYCTSSIDSATGFSVSTGVKGRTLRFSAG